MFQRFLFNTTTRFNLLKGYNIEYKTMAECWLKNAKNVWTYKISYVTALIKVLKDCREFESIKTKTTKDGVFQARFKLTILWTFKEILVKHFLSANDKVICF
jgi:hypothetical protein